MARLTGVVIVALSFSLFTHGLSAQWGGPERAAPRVSIEQAQACDASRSVS
jgi:hypothetical protein